MEIGVEVYDIARKEAVRLRSENDRLHQLVNKKSKKNHLLADEIQKEWDRSTRKTEKIKRLQRKLGDLLEEKKKADVSTQTENNKAITQTATQTDEPEVKSNGGLVTIVHVPANQPVKIEAVSDVLKSEPNCFDRVGRLRDKKPIKVDAVSRVHKSKPTRFARVDRIHVKQPIKAEVKAERGRFDCLKCGFNTNKKSTFDDHIKVFCEFVDAPKDHQCKMCGKWKTLIGLRHHLNNYLSGKHKPSGAHKLYTIDAVRAYRRELD